jgi:hypothetical protein
MQFMLKALQFIKEKKTSINQTKDLMISEEYKIYLWDALLSKINFSLNSVIIFIFDLTN